MNPELWSNLVVAEAWFRQNGPMHDAIPARLKEDPDYCMLIVEHCLHEADDFLSPSLKSSKDFMLRAVEKNPVAYVLALGPIKTDYDLTLASFGAANSDGLVHSMIEIHNDHAFAYLNYFLHVVQSKLQLHESLFTLLFGMSAFSGSNCQLSKLQQGQETSIIFKRLIADYLGSPIGNEFVQLRRAAVTLQRLPVPDVNRLRFMRSLHIVFEMAEEMAAETMDD